MEHEFKIKGWMGVLVAIPILVGVYIYNGGGGIKGILRMANPYQVSVSPEILWEKGQKPAAQALEQYYHQKYMMPLLEKIQSNPVAYPEETAQIVAYQKQFATIKVLALDVQYAYDDEGSRSETIVEYVMTVQYSMEPASPDGATSKRFLFETSNLKNGNWWVKNDL